MFSKIKLDCRQLTIRAGELQGNGSNMFWSRAEVRTGRGEAIAVVSLYHVDTL
jgi:hypothetical protein